MKNRNLPFNVPDRCYSFGAKPSGSTAFNGRWSSRPWQLLMPTLLLLCLIQATNVIGQSGYIYVHKKALNEESGVDFTFNITGGTTIIPTIMLNDRPDQLNVGDLGASHGAVTSATSGGDGQLWAVAIAPGTPNGNNATASVPHSFDGAVYTRLPNTSTWLLCANQTAQSIDGAGPNAMVEATHAGVGYYYEYNGTAKKIYDPANHSNLALLDITNNGSGATIGSLSTAVVDAGGNVRIYNGDYTNGSDSWTTIATIGSGTNIAQRLDMLPSTSATSHKIVVQKADGTIIILTTDGTLANTSQVTLAFPSNATAPVYTDVAYDDNGVIYATFKSSDGFFYVYEYSGTAWTQNIQARIFNALTAGAGGQVWAVNVEDGAAQNTIFSRTTDGSRTWLNDERVRTTYKDNSELFVVAPGTYTITETVPSGWALINITNYDATAANASSSLSAKTATITVAAGEVVHTVFTNELVVSTAVANSCDLQHIQTFDSTSSSTGGVQFHAPFPGSTSYHYSASNRPQDGQYTIVTTVKDSVINGVSNPGWYTQNSFINSDHTLHTANQRGYFLLINASYNIDEFHRQKVTGLIIGQQYVLSMWAANVSPSLPIKPNVLFGIANVTTGATIGSVNTGNISNAYWTQYTFNFTATTATADIFFRNNNVGGYGNDIAIDDITLNFPPTVFVRDINGTVALCSNTSSSYAFVDSAANGTWTISNNNLATITSTANTAAAGSASAYSTATVTPVTGATGTATLTYTIITGNCVSSISRDITIVNNCAGGTHTLSGTVYDDANGLNDNTVNGTATNNVGAGNTLYVAAFNNTTGMFIGVATVAANGTYSISGLADGQNISLILTTTNYTSSVSNSTVYTSRPASVLPATYGQTGENVGTTAGSDGNPNGTLTVGTLSSNIANNDFGFDQRPISANVTATVGNSGSHPVPTLSGTDPEDGTYNGTSLTNTIKIGATLPSTGKLYYNGVLVIVNQIIASYDPALLTFTPTSGNQFVFTYSEVDAAGLTSATFGIVTLNYSTVLPVVFGSLTALPKDCRIALSFEVLSESDNDRFVVQFSSDAISWKPLATIPSKGAGIYTYTDAMPINGIGYYRIEQVDIDSRFSFGKTVSAYSNCTGRVTIAAYPNPVKNVVTLTGATLGSKLVLVDLTGKVLVSQTANGSGVDEVYVNNIAQGLYIIKVISVDGSSATIKLNKQ